ncbi:hypothetical protein JM18_009664 [Phytophthora kernoviae]|uniref:Uncharacterized protein n=1 Tax=Phytophthora kernoviae TaxID=325452 RepID=A0A921S8C8_9STRA|nr:hypothetical protein JM18_009664 [Phytophthora kernoviae]
MLAPHGVAITGPSYNPDLANSAILGLTVQPEEWSVKRYTPMDPEYTDGTSVKINYDYKFIAGETYLKLMDDKGGYQDLITWDQLPEVVKPALNSTKFYSPLADEIYAKALFDGWPF